MAEQIPLGQPAADDAQRDAVHVAIVPVTSDVQLFPGLRVKLVDGTTDKVEPAHSDAVGIVDPFLSGTVPPGTRFYLCLMPNTVTGMRHHWEHPAFTADNERSESEKWLRCFAVRMNVYDDDEEVAFNRLIDGFRTGELYAYGSELHGLFDIDDPGELKMHAESYLGISIDWSDFTFSCSC